MHHNFPLNLLQKMIAHDSVTDMTQNFPIDLNDETRHLPLDLLHKMTENVTRPDNFPFDLLQKMTPSVTKPEIPILIYYRK